MTIAERNRTSSPLQNVLAQTKVRTTGIGSLPHHNVDTAIEFAFKWGIPFLPQVPIRHPWEYMIAQAIEGLPGLELEKDGLVTLNLDVWKSQSHLLSHRLDKAFKSQISQNSNDAFEAFEPSASTSSCWEPFLWELQERGIKVAKLQIAGPFTAQWALKIKEGTSPDRYPELATQIYRLVLARSLAMVNRMKACSIQPILYLDEPGFYGLSDKNPKHVLCLQELKFMIQTLQKAGAIVGVHCCSNTLWETILNLGIDILSLDTTLSLTSALDREGGKPLETFVKSGGVLSLGVIPTTRTSALRALDPRVLRDQLVSTLNARWNSTSVQTQKILKQSILTPACGLAFQSTSDVELVLDKLMEVYEFLDS